MGSLNIDEELLLSWEQDVHAASAASTNLLDFEVADPNLGEGTKVSAIFIVTTAFDGDATVAFEIQDSADGSTFNTLVKGETLTTPAAGAGFVAPLPNKHEQYLRAYYTVTQTTATTGAVTAFLTAV